MTNTCSSSGRGAGAFGPGPAAGVDVYADAVASSPGAEPTEGQALAALAAEVAHAERHLARAVTLAGQLAGSGAAERVEGLPLELFLGLQARMTGGDRRMLITAGEVLAGMPTLARLFAEQSVSWGQVRAVVTAVKRLDAAARLEVDSRLEATVTTHGGVDVMDPDELVWAVDAAVDDVRGARNVERAEARRVRRNVVAVQPSLDGGLQLYADLDPVAGAPVLNALDAAAGSPRAEASQERGNADRNAAAGTGQEPGSAAVSSADSAAAPDAGGGRWRSTARGHQYAEALGRVCADWLGGRRGRSARPLLVAHVDLTQVTTATAGTVELAVRGGLPRISAAAAEALAADADVRAVLFDGARPLAVSGKVNAAAIPANTRFAVRARDRGCRFPGSPDPLAHTDVHHLVERARNGSHHPDNLVSLSRRFHTLTHRHGWRLTLHPDTGQVTAHRRHRTYRSLPRGTPLARPPNPAPPPEAPPPGEPVPF